MRFAACFARARSRALQHPACWLVLCAAVFACDESRTTPDPRDAGHVTPEPDPDEPDAETTDDEGPGAAPDAEVPASSSRCRGALPSPTAGGPCGCSSDCDVGEVCATETAFGLPRGQCVRSCSTDRGCPSGFHCIGGLENDPTAKGCLQECKQSSDCPLARECAEQLTLDYDLCMPKCFSDADCPETDSCNHYTGLCEAVDMALGDNGALCKAGRECRSGLCNVTYGFCYSTCTVERGGCPGGSICRPVGTSLTDTDLGACRQSCNDDSNCVAGFHCSANKICVSD